MEDSVNGTVPAPAAADNASASSAMEHWDPVIFYVEGVGISAVGAAGMALNALAVIVLARQGGIKKAISGLGHIRTTTRDTYTWAGLETW